MVTEPVGKGGLIKVTARQREYERDNILFRCIDPEAVQTEKKVHGLEGDTLVAVHKGMIARKSKPVRGGDCGKIRLGVVLESVAGAVEGRLQEPPVPKPEGAAVGLNLISVDGEDLY